MTKKQYREAMEQIKTLKRSVNLKEIPTQELIKELKKRGLDCFDPRLKFTNKIKYEYAKNRNSGNTPQSK